ncbi:MAG: hypothetical protein JNK79_04610 [Chitinophagaceae bacterium]|nr:hypothetical protein [Chitinophagaceae bacterium]
MKLALTFFAIFTISFSGLAQDLPVEYKVVTVVESIVPGGMGRSRIIETKSDVVIGNATTERTNGKDSQQGKVKRKDLKVDELSETKLLNFYSLTGINFQNIASNDALIAAKINELGKDGWKLLFVTSGVESNAGSQDGEGIFITRLVFSKS